MNWSAVNMTLSFGMTVSDIAELTKSGYDCWKYYNSDPQLKAVIDSFIDGSYSVNREEFKPIFDELMYHNDEYLLLADFRAYVEAQAEVERRYNDKEYWATYVFGQYCKIRFLLIGSYDPTICG